MLRYNWTRIFNAAGGNVLECYRIFEMITYKKLPDSIYDKLYYYTMKDFSGESFLKYPERLIYNAYRLSLRDICIYLAVASQRSYAAYKVSGTLTLELIHSRIDPRDHLENLNLLPVEKGIIHFPYEEKGELKWH